jgi:predicted RNase H-like HicB family nuclease
MKYPVLIHKESSSDFGVTVPDLPGCYSAGTTMEEALESAQEAVLTHVEGLLMDQEPIPTPSGVESLLLRWNEKGAVWALVPVDLSVLSKRAKRVNITVPENLLRKIDAFAMKDGDSRSGLLVTAALQYIAQKQRA